MLLSYLKKISYLWRRNPQNKSDNDLNQQRRNSETKQMEGDHYKHWCPVFVSEQQSQNESWDTLMKPVILEQESRNLVLNSLEESKPFQYGVPHFMPILLTAYTKTLS